MLTEKKQWNIIKLSLFWVVQNQTQRIIDDAKGMGIDTNISQLLNGVFDRDPDEGVKQFLIKNKLGITESELIELEEIGQELINSDSLSKKWSEKVYKIASATLSLL